MGLWDVLSGNKARRERLLIQRMFIPRHELEPAPPGVCPVCRNGLAEDPFTRFCRSCFRVYQLIKCRRCQRAPVRDWRRPGQDRYCLDCEQNWRCPHCPTRIPYQGSGTAIGAHLNAHAAERDQPKA